MGTEDRGRAFIIGGEVPISSSQFRIQKKGIQDCGHHIRIRHVEVKPGDKLWVVRLELSKFLEYAICQENLRAVFGTIFFYPKLP